MHHGTVQLLKIIISHAMFEVLIVMRIDAEPMQHGEYLNLHDTLSSLNRIAVAITVLGHYVDS